MITGEDFRFSEKTLLYSIGLLIMELERIIMGCILLSVMSVVLSHLRPDARSNPESPQALPMRFASQTTSSEHWTTLRLERSCW